MSRIGRRVERLEREREAERDDGPDVDWPSNFEVGCLDCIAASGMGVSAFAKALDERGVPEPLRISRREQPRPPHPANTVLLGGGLTLVSTFSMPTGWYLVGRTPERMFAPVMRSPAPHSSASYSRLNS